MGFLRELFVYPGRNERHDYVAYRLQNTYIYGKDAEFCVNNLLIRLIQESNPNELEIFPYFMDENIWKTSVEVQEKRNKYVPQMQRYCIFESGADFVSAVKEAYTRIQVDVSSHEMAIKNYLYVFKFEGTMTDSEIDEVSSMLSYISTYGPADGVFVWMVGECLAEFAGNMTLHMNACSAMVERRLQKGVVFVIPEGQSEGEMLWCPFYPNTWIAKFIRIYAINMKAS